MAFQAIFGNIFSRQTIVASLQSYTVIPDDTCNINTLVQVFVALAIVHPILVCPTDLHRPCLALAPEGARPIFSPFARGQSQIAVVGRADP